MCFPHIAAQSVVYPVPCPQEPPASKVIVDRLIRRKVLRQQAPLATATQDVEDSIWTTLCWTWPLGTRNACGSAKPADKRENPLHRFLPKVKGNPTGFSGGSASTSRHAKNHDDPR